MNAKNDEHVPRERMHPAVKLLIGVVVGVAAAWLVVSTAGGLGDAIAAVGRMRPEFVAIAVTFAVLRIALFGLQFFWLGRRTGPLRFGTAMGLSLVVYGFGAITPAAPAEGLAIASRELRRRGRSQAAGTNDLRVLRVVLPTHVLRDRSARPAPRQNARPSPNIPAAIVAVLDEWRAQFLSDANWSPVWRRYRTGGVDELEALLQSLTHAALGPPQCA